MIFTLASQCQRCENYLENRSCKAFKEIPEALWDGDESHYKPYPNDNGILFKAKPMTMPDAETFLSGKY
jgi:hypothetical protein